jgi:hypothetical protein
MKHIVQVWLASTLLAAGGLRAQAPIGPAQLDVNLGPFEVDKYDGTSLTPAGAIGDGAACTQYPVYRDCVRHILSNYDGNGAGDGDYNSQGVLGVAIQIANGRGRLFEYIRRQHSVQQYLRGS